MKDIQTDPDEDIPDLLADWISREQLARALGLTADTLSRWEARRQGPPCTRIGRKTFYRRAAIQEWIRAQEQAHPVRSTLRITSISPSQARGFTCSQSPG